MRQMWAKRISCTADCDFTWQDEENSTARTHTVLKPDLVFLFGPADLLRASGAAERLAGTYPGAILIGCSSGTMVSAPHLLDDVMTGLAVGFERTRVKLATVDFEGAPSSEAAGRALGAQLAAPDLAGVFVLSDGLDINGSALVKGLAATAGDKATFSGGLAGDGARFSQTLVTVGGPPRSKLVAAIGFYGDSVKLAYGSAGGWDEFGPHRRITRAEGNVLFELDDKPALDLYERYLGPEARDLPASGLLYPLKVWDPERSGDSVVRTILSIDREARSMTFAGDVPQGAGLSSSASLGVALGGAFSAIGEFGLGETDIALIAQASENRYVGTACGNMDQLAAAHGRAGHTLMIDCRSLSVTPVAMPDDFAVLIVHSGITRGLVDSAYNERRKACEAAAAALGVAALRDATPAMVDAAALDPATRARARHVVTENARVAALANAIAAQDWGAIGELMAASHASMRDDFAITLPPIDALVEVLTQAAGGRGGARMTGGGFGGCVVALVAQNRLDAVQSAAVAWFARDGRTSPLIHACRPSAGLRVDHI